MPLLKQEPDLYPDGLLGDGADGAIVSSFSQDPEAKWFAVYTLSRHEKKLMRQLYARQIPFYSPLVGRRFRSPNGRARTTFEPIFPNYVFLCANESQRYTALSTNSVSRCLVVPSPQELIRDLRRIRQLIATGAALTPETQLAPGDLVRVKSGPLKGVEGVVLRRENEVRLLVAVRYLQRGASVVLTDNSFEAI